MMEVGRVCVKTAGRDAGHLAVVVDKPEGLMVLVDGNVRRKKCNIRHLEPTEQKIDIKAKASTEDVLNAMKKAGLVVIQKTVSKKEKKKSEKPMKKRKTKAKSETKEKKAVKK